MPPVYTDIATRILDLAASSDSRKQLLLPPWAWGGIIGAGAGALSSLWSQRKSASTDWAEVGGQALIWGASGSLCARLCSGVVKAAH
jgi:hypothetical protein